MKTYETVIGLEIHAQLSTKTKIFCSCPTQFGSVPNTQTCPICIGMPGVLPVLNKKVVEFVIKAGLATNCTISKHSRFARKNYFYPDLPKGYQISQFDLPLCQRGSLTVGDKIININRIHIEEDAGKNIHDSSDIHSLVDLNRAGVPLMEIVTEPDIASPLEAGAFMRKLRAILRYLEICDGNMEEGSLRCDANISLRPIGQKELGVKAEVKNLNSFRYVEKALEYEIERQTKILTDGGRIIQETRLFNTQSGKTISMRSKEESHDYRYFPEPDLVPIEVSDQWINEIRETITELPDQKTARFVRDYKLPSYDADLLSLEKYTADWFEEAVRLGGDSKQVSNWMMGELMRLLNEKNLSLDKSPLKPNLLVDMLKLVTDGTISGKIAKTVFEDMFNTGKSASEIVKEKGLVQISDLGELDTVIDEIIKSNSKEYERYKAGETKLLGFFVGLVMKATKGKANPKLLNSTLQKKLST
ncbi:MAG: Asp-tRNA(Asn)/Glu-tRNA(Gln) amidotransferase subunit GatB [Nitrospirae bacterium]|nr:Asp-tRNA(Asn)/Glu-tRNA(Gln) amidotransferase subunit GatB [Nitrospirota bacterium]